MDKSTKRRAVLFGLLAVTLVAAFAPQDEFVNDQSVVPATPIATPPLSLPAIASGPPTTLTAETTPTVDPFAPRDWLPPTAPVASVPAPVAVTVAPPLPQAPAGPPPLPYQFMGRLNDGDRQMVYLSKGDQPLVARIGETLEGTYKVLGIEPGRIDFEYTPTGERQSLNLPAPEN